MYNSWTWYDCLAWLYLHWHYQQRGPTCLQWYREVSARCSISTPPLCSKHSIWADPQLLLSETGYKASISIWQLSVLVLMFNPSTCEENAGRQRVQKKRGHIVRLSKQQDKQGKTKPQSTFTMLGNQWHQNFNMFEWVCNDKFIVGTKLTLK